MEVTTVGIDLAKNVFSLHGVDEAGRVPDPQDGALLTRERAIRCEHGAATAVTDRSNDLLDSISMITTN